MGITYYWDNITKKSFENEGNHYSNLHLYRKFFPKEVNLFDRIVKETIEEFDWEITDHIICKTFESGILTVIEYKDQIVEVFLIE
jgi:hypothetical protein